MSFKQAKQPTGSLDTSNYAQVAMAIKNLLDGILDPNGDITPIHPSAIPAAQKLLNMALLTYRDSSPEFQLVHRALTTAHGTLTVDAFRTYIEQHQSSLASFNSSRITRETVDVARAANLHMFVTALIETAGGPKTLSTKLP